VPVNQEQQLLKNEHSLVILEQIGFLRRSLIIRCRMKRSIQCT